MGAVSAEGDLPMSAPELVRASRRRSLTHDGRGEACSGLSATGQASVLEQVPTSRDACRSAPISPEMLTELTRCP